ncbi:MAG: hypothetical protein AAF797_09295 [Planctomycetota bacterium]
MPTYRVTGIRPSDGKRLDTTIDASSEESVRRKAERAGIDMQTFSCELADVPAINAPVVIQEPTPVFVAPNQPPVPAPQPAMQPVYQPQAPVIQPNFVNNNNVVVQMSGQGQTAGGLIPAIASFFIPGLGQLIKGQPINGIAWFIVVIIGYIAFIIPGLILHICCIVGAASSTNKEGGAPVAVVSAG